MKEHGRNSTHPARCYPGRYCGSIEAAVSVFVSRASQFYNGLYRTPSHCYPWKASLPENNLLLLGGSSTQTRDDSPGSTIPILVKDGQGSNPIFTFPVRLHSRFPSIIPRPCLHYATQLRYETSARSLLLKKREENKQRSSGFTCSAMSRNFSFDGARSTYTGPSSWNPHLHPLPRTCFPGFRWVRWGGFTSSGVRGERKAT